MARERREKRTGKDPIENLLKEIQITNRLLLCRLIQEGAPPEIVSGITGIGRSTLYRTLPIKELKKK